MTLSELWKEFRLLQSPEAFSEAERTFLERFLREEHRLRERRRTEFLMKMSGIGRPKLFDDFDWTFNPKIPRDKIGVRIEAPGRGPWPVVLWLLEGLIDAIISPPASGLDQSQGIDPR
jgi:hypothetical protein